MKKLLLSFAIAVMGVSALVADADAKRLGGGGSVGMQRSIPHQTPTAVPAQRAPTATPAPTTAATPAVAPKRSWMGPIAGIAAGLGLGMLMSHLGLGAGFGNFLTMALMAVVAFVAIRFLMQRFGPKRAGDAQAPQGMQFAGAGPAGGLPPQSPPESRGWGSAVLPAATALAPAATVLTPAASRIPAGFDTVAFERIAKMIFIRMQAANDAGDLNDLRQFATPEMFAAFRLDLQDRKDATQKTDVVQLDAEVLDVADEAARQIVSVRFHGLIREEANAPTTTFDEVWHLVRPKDGSHEWAIAGIGQNVEPAPVH